MDAGKTIHESWKSGARLIPGLLAGLIKYYLPTSVLKTGDNRADFWASAVFETGLSLIPNAITEAITAVGKENLRYIDWNGHGFPMYGGGGGTIVGKGNSMVNLVF